MLLILGTDRGADGRKAWPPTLPPVLAADASWTEPSVNTPAARVTTASLTGCCHSWEKTEYPTHNPFFINTCEKTDQRRWKENQKIPSWRNYQKICDWVWRHYRRESWWSWGGLHELVLTEYKICVLGLLEGRVLRVLVRQLSRDEAIDMFVTLLANYVPILTAESWHGAPTAILMAVALFFVRGH